MTDYERGVEDASNIYKAVIREYVAENARLRALSQLQDELAKAVHKYWASSERSLDDFNAMMDANNKVLTLMSELGIETGYARGAEAIVRHGGGGTTAGMSG